MTFSAKMGDPFASREKTVEAMIRKLGRDTSDMTLTPGTITSPATLEDDPDVRNAWDCLVQVAAEVFTKFAQFDTVYYVNGGSTDESIAPGSGGAYFIPPTSDSGSLVSTTYGDLIGAIQNDIVSVKVISSPAGLNLVYRGEPSVAPRLFDTVTAAYGDFTGMGNVELAVTYFIRWEFIPFAFRNYIFTRAARRLVSNALGPENVAVQTLKEDELVALAGAQAYDIEQSPVNMRDGTMWDVDDRTIAGGSTDDVFDWS